MIVHLAVRSRFDAGQSIKVRLGAFFPSLKLHAPQNRGRRHRCTWKNEDTDMPINLHGRNVLVLDDFSGADIRHLLRLAADLKAAKRAGAVFLNSDFKKRGGYLLSTQLSREYGIYRQDYCGCVFSKRERENQNS